MLGCPGSCFRGWAGQLTTGAAEWLQKALELLIPTCILGEGNKTSTASDLGFLFFFIKSKALTNWKILKLYLHHPWKFIKHVIYLKGLDPASLRLCVWGLDQRLCYVECINELLMEQQSPAENMRKLKHLFSNIPILSLRVALQQVIWRARKGLNPPAAQGIISPRSRFLCAVTKFLLLCTFVITLKMFLYHG